MDDEGYEVRITFVVPTLEVSGGARIVVGHAERLAARGHDVVLIAPRPNRVSLRNWAKYLMGRNPLHTPQKRTPVKRADVPLYIPRHVGRIVEADVPNADFIIATWWETAEWIRKFPAEKGHKTHFIQGYEAFPNMPAGRIDAVWQLPYFKVAVSQWLVDLGRERFGIDEVALAPNSIDDGFRSNSLRSKKHPPTVGFLFHNAVCKDLPTTLQTIEQLKQLHPEIRFLSFGSMKPGRGELPSHVEFHHLPSQEKIADIYQQCDAWLSTSGTEGFNLPPLEAMASGCPAVCGKTGRPLEILKNGINGYLVDPGNVMGFADALNAILTLPEQEWINMSDAARDAVAHPTWDESSALFEEALIRHATGPTNGLPCEAVSPKRS